jgi:hypothetical protein
MLVQIKAIQSTALDDDLKVLGAQIDISLIEKVVGLGVNRFHSISGDHFIKGGNPAVSRMACEYRKTTLGRSPIAGNAASRAFIVGFNDALVELAARGSTHVLGIQQNMPAQRRIILN